MLNLEKKLNRETYSSAQWDELVAMAESGIDIMQYSDPDMPSLNLYQIRKAIEEESINFNEHPEMLSPDYPWQDIWEERVRVIRERLREEGKL